MPDRSRKPKKGREDVNEIAARIRRQATGEDNLGGGPKSRGTRRDGVQKREAAPNPTDDNALRSEAARILGRLGGKKGGPARAKKLSKKRRSEIARKAAQARWSKSGP